MIEKKEYLGYWWAPENPERKVGGVLTYDPEEGIKLQLFSALKSNFEDNIKLLASKEVVRFDNLLGVTTSGDKITLLDCARRKGSLKLKKGIGKIVSNYVAKYLLVGGHYKNRNVEFDSLKVNFSLFEKWARITPIKENINAKDPPYFSAGDSIEISYEAPDSVKVQLEDFKISIISGADTSFKQFEKGSIKTRVYFKIEPLDGPARFQKYLDYISNLQNFLTFGTRTPIKPQIIKGRRDDSKDLDTDVEIFHRIRAPEVPEKVHPYHMNFQLTDIRDNLESVLKNWFKKSENLKPVFDLYFGTFYNRSMYVQNEFLSLCQALEIYYRKAYEDVYLSEDKFQQVYEDLGNFLDGQADMIPKNLDEKYELSNGFKDHLKGGTFKYANEYSLRKRLSEIVDEHEEILEELPFNVGSKISKITDTRNYLTHYDEELEEKAAGLEELPGLNRILKLLVEICLFSEIGIPREHIKQRLSSQC